MDSRPRPWPDEAHTPLNRQPIGHGKRNGQHTSSGANRKSNLPDSRREGDSGPRLINSLRSGNPCIRAAVKRNIDRFLEDSMFQLTKDENLKSQIVTSSWGGRRTAPYAFTEHGIAMLSSVLRSPRAVQVNIEIMRTFVRLRRLLASHADLAQKLSALERKYDRLSTTHALT